MLPLKGRFRDSQIVSITNLVGVSSVGIKKLSVCRAFANSVYQDQLASEEAN